MNRADRTPKIVVQLVEDNPGDARLFEELLAEGELETEIRREASLEAGLEACRQHPPDVLVVDLNLPDSGGLETVRRASDSLPDLPLVVLTGREDRDTATRALGSGASEYLRKNELTPVLVSRTLRMAVERRRLEAEARHERALSRSILRSLQEHIAVVDGDGTIRAVNQAWIRFAESEGGDPRGYEGENYLRVTAEAAAGGSEDAKRVRAGLETVLSGDEEYFAHEYPCHSPEERRWFRVAIAPLVGERGSGAVVSHVDITDRKERERFLTTLIDNVPGVLYRCRNEPDWPLEFISAGVEGLIGVAPDELLREDGPTYGEHIHPEDRDRVWREVQEALEADLPFELEYRIQSSAGEEKWVWEKGQLVPSPSGAGEQLEGYIVDVTSRVEARRRIEEAEAKWSSIVELVPVGIVISHPDTGRFLTVNRAVASMLGYEPADADDATAGDLGIWVEPERREELVARIREEGEVTNAEIRLRHRSGGIRHARVSVRLLELGGGEWLLWSVQDVTESREREAALRESETRYRTLVETMAEATVILDDACRLTFANEEAQELLGLEEAKISGPAYDDPEWKITTPGGRAFAEEELPFRRVMDSGQPVRDVVLSLETQDGSRRRILSVNAAPLPQQGGGQDRVVATFRDITEQNQLERQLEHQALHDPLTGLANRTLLNDRLDQALARSRRRGEPMGLLMIDLDDFKRINDHLGHSVGDQVLNEVARRLVRVVRDADTVARWGGDEFLVILPELDDPSDLERLEVRLRNEIENPIPTDGESLQITATVGGVVQATEGDDARTITTEEPEDLIRFADLALHGAKNRARAGFFLYSETEEFAEVPDLALEQDLRRGLDAGEITVFYQPIVRLEEGGLWGFEALARWRHPERGLVAPADFVPLAERVGLIHPLGAAVLREGSGQMARWRSEHPAASHLVLSFNLSARQLQDPGIVDDLREALETSGLPAESVIFEVTETAIMKAPGRVEAIQSLGVRVFIDDFGTGYSTFTYLRELDVQGLKIDRSFVRDLADRPAHSAIVESMVILSRRLGISLVAEGIETEQERQELERLGCRLGQGFHLGRPAPSEQIERSLRRGDLA